MLATAPTEVTLYGTQADFVEDQHRFAAFVGGIGCIAAETLIEGVPVAELAAPSVVRTLYGPARATPAFRKGRANLYRVQTRSGAVVTVTAEHRFLTPVGWRPLAALGVGAAIAADETVHGHLGSERAPDWQGRYAQDFRLDDGLPTRPARDAPSKWLPLRRTADDTSTLLPCHPSTGHFSPPVPVSHGVTVAQCEPCEGGGGLPQGLRQTPVLDRRRTHLRGIGRQPHPLVAGVTARASHGPDGCHAAVGCATPRIDVGPAVQLHGVDSQALETQSEQRHDLESSWRYSNIIWDEVDSISFARYGDFYDLTVPGIGHYAAAGLWHHNSGKTLGGATKALLQEFGQGGRLGLVIAPTYPMLRDATWRTALEVWAPLQPQVYRQEMRMAFATGDEVLFRSADDPDRLRGPNASWAWIDEAAFCVPGTWPTIIGRLREDGRAGRAWVTTTPKGRNWVWQVFVQQASPDTAAYRATTAGNPFVDPAFVAALRGQYTARLARQELEGDWLEDIEGALWTWAMLDHRQPAPDLTRVVVAVDPAATNTAESDETGIVVAGLGVDGRGYVLADRSCRLSPDGWARRALAAYDEFSADRLVAEVNNGGDMVKQVLDTVWRDQGRAGGLPYTKVTASRGKLTRAEPVAALYEQGRISHTTAFTELEDQLTSWTPESGTSPDRLDALVWALSWLLVTARHGWRAL